MSGGSGSIAWFPASNVGLTWTMWGCGKWELCAMVNYAGMTGCTDNHMEGWQMSGTWALNRFTWHSDLGISISCTWWFLCCCFGKVMWLFVVLCICVRDVCVYVCDADWKIMGTPIIFCMLFCYPLPESQVSTVDTVAQEWHQCYYMGWTEEENQGNHSGTSKDDIPHVDSENVCLI